MATSHYAILGVPPSASVEEIRAAFKKRALVLHPDKNPNGGEGAFKQLLSAYEALNDKAKRRSYDAQQQQQQQQPQWPRPAQPRPSQPQQQRRFTTSDMDPFQTSRFRQAEDNITRDAFRDYYHSQKQSRATPCPPPPPPPRQRPSRDEQDRRTREREEVQEEAEAMKREAERMRFTELERLREETARAHARKVAEEREREEVRRRAEAIRQELLAQQQLCDALKAQRAERERRAEEMLSRKLEKLREERGQALADGASKQGVPVAVAAAATEQFQQAVTNWDLEGVLGKLRDPAVVVMCPFSHPQLGEATTAAHCVAAFAHRKQAASTDEAVVDEALKKVLSVPGAMSARDSVGRVPLHLSASNGAIRPLRIALAVEGAKAAVSATDETGSSPLDFAATNGHLNAIELLLAAGASPNGPPDNKRRTPLHSAVRYSNTSAAAALLRAGAAVDPRDVIGWTPCHFAAADGNTDCLRVLLAAGADPRAATKDGETPRSLAAQARGMGKSECLALLDNAQK